MQLGFFFIFSLLVVVFGCALFIACFIRKELVIIFHNALWLVIFQVSFMLGVVPVFISWIYAEILEYKKSLAHSKL